MVGGCSLPKNTAPEIVFEITAYIVSLLLKEIQAFTGDVCTHRRHESSTSEPLSVSSSQDLSTNDSSEDFRMAEAYRVLQGQDSSQVLILE